MVRPVKIAIIGTTCSVGTTSLFRSMHNSTFTLPLPSSSTGDANATHVEHEHLSMQTGDANHANANHDTYIQKRATATNPPLEYKTRLHEPFVIALARRFATTESDLFRSKCHCLYLVYDVSNRKSFQKIMHRFQRFFDVQQSHEIQLEDGEGMDSALSLSDFDWPTFCPIVLVGNKVDLRRNNDTNKGGDVKLKLFVSRVEGLSMRNQLEVRMKKITDRSGQVANSSVLFLETSCQTKFNITECINLGNLLGLKQRSVVCGSIDDSAFNYLYQREIQHLQIGGPTLLQDFSKLNFQRCCESQQEIMLQFMSRRRSSSGSNKQALKIVPVFLRRYVLTFLAVCENEDLWYNTYRLSHMGGGWNGRCPEMTFVGMPDDGAPPPTVVMEKKKKGRCVLC